MELSSDAVDKDLLQRFDDAVAASLRGAPASLDHFYGMMRYQLGIGEANPISPRHPQEVPLGAALCLVCFKAVGGRGEVGPRAAAALTLQDAWFRIHSDIENSRASSGTRPALWTLEGTAQAINTGDGLFPVAMNALMASVPNVDIALSLSRRLTHVSLAYLNGQYLLLASNQKELSGAERKQACELMWGSFGDFGAWTGALLGGAGEDMQRALRAFGFSVGMVAGLRFFAAEDEVDEYLRKSLTVLDEAGLPAAEKQQLRSLVRTVAGQA